MKPNFTSFIVVLATFGALAACTTSNEPTPGGRGYAVTGCDPMDRCAAGATCREDLCLPACTADADCPDGAVCRDGSCFASGGGGACRADTDCPADHVCVAGMCAELPAEIPCTADPTCPAGSRCDPSGACVTRPPSCDAVAETCNGVDDDCDGLVDEGGDASCEDGDPSTADTCSMGRCEHGAVGGCGVSGAVCGAGETCIRGVCVGSEPMCTPEVCGNGVDDNCDGYIDEGCGGPMTCASDADCDDGDPATPDACERGICLH